MSRRYRLTSLARHWCVCRTVAMLSWLCLLASPTLGQTAEFTQANKSSSAMSLDVSLGNVPGRGVSLPVNLHYSTQGLWRIGFINSVYANTYVGQVRQSVTEAIYAEHSTAGWTTSLDVPKVEWPKLNDRFWANGKPYANGYVYGYTYRIARVFIHMPDGSTHELRKADAVYQDDNYVDMSGIFYAVDGSRMRYDSSGETTGTLYLSDGTRYILNGSTTQYIDRNGNTLNYNATSRQWTDTMGRTINMPWPSNPSPGEYPYSLPGINGTPITYTLKFSYLSGAFLPDVSGQTQKPIADRYLPIPNSTPTSWNQNNFPQGPGANYLFQSVYTDPEETEQSYVHVVGKGQSEFTNFDPVVLTEIDLPNGQKYQFYYNAFGELDKVIYPTGGYQRYQYGPVATIGVATAPYTQGTRGMLSRWISPSGSGSDEAQWTYSGGVYPLTVTAPDSTGAPYGTRSETYLYTPSFYSDNNFGYEDARNGQPVEERIYAPASQGGAMLRRTLIVYEQSSATINKPVQQYYPGTYTAYRNARPIKTVSVNLDTFGDSVLASTTTMGYDPSFEFTVGPDATSSTEYDYAVVGRSTAETATISSIPLGPLVRTTQTTYLTSDANYRNRNIVGLASSVTILNSSGQTVAQTVMSYDEAAYPILNYGTLTGWSNPQTNYRGNLTTTSRWLDYPTSTWIQTHAEYDQCGRPLWMWDANGNQSRVEYSSAYGYAYPTSTISPNPDNSQVHADATGLVVTSSFDFNTGLVTATTDANGRVTTFEYNDPLNRLTKVNRPDGSWTSTTYNDVPGNIYVRTQTLQESTPTQHVIEAYQFFDKLGRASRSFFKEGSTYLTGDTQYDNLGRAWRVSNPYRTNALTDAVNPSNIWTTSTYDALSRVVSVTTPDNAQGSATYGGSTSGAIGTTVTATDQTGKSRKSITDAQGRLIQVVEDPNNLGYQTNYTYDVLNNLRKVEQGAQLRYFGYDSLSRLIRVKSVEQAINTALNWTDPVTGYPGGWTAAFSYEANGNLTSRVDARNITSNYTHDGLNRVTTVRYVNDPQNTPGIDFFYDGYRNGNQSVANSAGQVWQVETAGQTLLTVDSFDVLGRATSQRQQFYVNGQWSQAYTVSRIFDLAGHVKTETYPSGRTVNYAFDDAGRTTSFSGNLGDSASRNYSQNISYSPYGGISQEQFGTTTPVYNKLFYNVRGQLAEIRVGTTANDTSWNRGAIINHYSDACWGMCSGSNMTDNNGNLKRQDVVIPADDAINGWTLSQDVYAYDGLNRLKSATENSGSNTQGQVQAWSQNFEYDRWGNRTSAQMTIGNGPSARGATAFAPSTRHLPTQMLAPVSFSPVIGMVCEDCGGGINEPPEANAGGPYSGQTGESIQFDGNNSYDSDGWIVSYSWNFGDGQTESGPSPTHSYTNAGTFTVTLTVTDNGGQHSSSSTTATISAQPPTTFNNAAFVAQTVPGSMTAGQSYNVTVTMQNTGSTIWRAATSYRLGSQNPQDNGTWGIGRVELPSDVMPNAQVTFSFAVTAPQAQGVYDFQWRMVQDSVEWFGEYSPNVQVTVTAASQSGALIVDPTTNRVLATNGSISYDNAGNIINDSYTGNGSRTYDAENRMLTAQDVTGALSYYSYDGSGRRVRRNTGGVETWQIYGFGGELIAEYAANSGLSAPQKEYGYRNGQLLITASGSANVHWLVTDQLGTPRMIVDLNGSLTGVSRHDYMPFGEELYAGVGGRSSSNGYTNTDGARQKFTGYEADSETGLNFAQARYQSPGLGRFTSVDPLGRSASITNPQSFNRYSYVLNNPTNSTDPSGMIPYSGADVGWSDVADGFWGSDLGGPRPSAGQQAIAAAMARHDRYVENDMNGGEYGEEETEPPPHVLRPGMCFFQDPGTLSGTVVDPQDPPGTLTGTVREPTQSELLRWKEELENDIRFSKDARAAYGRFGRIARTVEQLEAMVDAFLTRRYGQIQVAGTTSSSGQVQIRPDPNPYRVEATRRHEEVHRQTVLAAIARYGANTPAFRRWRDNPRIWAADEVKAYSADIRYMQQVLRRWR